MKLCKQCEHAKRNIILGWRYAKCFHPKNMETSFVAGGIVFKQYEFCETHRMYDTDGVCGKSGRWFEQKIHWWEKA